MKTYGWTVPCKYCGKNIPINQYGPTLQNRVGHGILFCNSEEREKYIEEHPEILEKYPIKRF